jgi:phosphohistidine phosphatase
MRLLVVRHAIAEDREAFARTHQDDSPRPLTPEGRRKMERAALGLKELLPELDLLAASPYKRAVETAEIVAQAYDQLTVERVAELTPGAGVDRVVAWLSDRQARGTLGIVGHEPDLSQLVCTLLAGANRPFLELRKGAACLLEFAGPVAKGAATLDWFLGPKHLRRLGEGG